VIRVLLCDDQALVRQGFRRLLDAEEGIEVVGEAEDGEQAVALAARRSPDVVLMDIRMPRLDGIEATRRITGGPAPAPKVLILTTFGQDEYVFQALRAGASGFLLKDESLDRLLEAINVVAGGSALLSPEVTRTVIARFAGEGRPAEPPPAFAELTTREREVLDRLGRGATNAEIAAELVLGEATVKTHVSSVLLKLGLRDRTQAVVFAYEHGLVRPGGA
jgi:DNA-binding NarL/FixJ family response regulator